MEIIGKHEQKALEDLEQLRLRQECVNICIKYLGKELVLPSVITMAHKMQWEFAKQERELEIDLRIAKLADKHIQVYQDGPDHACIEYHDGSGRKCRFIYGSGVDDQKDSLQAEGDDEDYFKYMNEALNIAEEPV